MTVLTPTGKSQTRTGSWAIGAERLPGRERRLAHRRPQRPIARLPGKRRAISAGGGHAFVTLSPCGRRFGRSPTDEGFGSDEMLRRLGRPRATSAVSAAKKAVWPGPRAPSPEIPRSPASSGTRERAAAASASSSCAGVGEGFPARQKILVPRARAERHIARFGLGRERTEARYLVARSRARRSPCSHRAAREIGGRLHLAGLAGFLRQSNATRRAVGGGGVG